MITLFLAVGRLGNRSWKAASGAGSSPIRIGSTSSKKASSTTRVGTVTLVTLKGEDHWLSSEETRIEALESIGAFLATCLAE